MNFNFRNISCKRDYTSLATSKHQNNTKDKQVLQDNNKNIHKLNKNEQIVSEQKGKYNYTYKVDKCGKKILLNKVSTSEFKKQNNLQKLSEYNKLRSCNYNSAGNYSANFAYRQQMINSLNGSSAKQSNLQKILISLKD